MKFSLILATEGRSTELSRFLEHLARQSYDNFELILIDQNPDDRIINVIDPFLSQYQIKYIRSKKKGLSRSRNIGIQYAHGEIFAFPDDDCWYPPNLLIQLAKLFKNNPAVDGYTGKTIDEKGKSIIRYSKRPGYLTPLNAWYRANSSSMFFRSAVIADVGDFDEELGPGSGTLWGCGDDVDYVIRCIERGYRLFFDPRIVSFHQDHRQFGYERLHSRALQYGAGIGRVWKKHNFPLWYVTYHLIRPLSGAIFSLLTANSPKSKYHWLDFLGRLQGWRS